MDNSDHMMFYQEEISQPQQARDESILRYQNSYNGIRINGIEQKMNYNYGFQNLQNGGMQREDFLHIDQNNFYQQQYLQNNNIYNIAAQNQIESQQQQSQANLHSVNFYQSLEEEQISIKQLRKSEKGLYNYENNNDKMNSSKCVYSEKKLLKKRKIETNDDLSKVQQIKTNRELLEEKAVYVQPKINSGEVSYNSYKDGIGNNNKTSISQYCQARFLDEKNKRMRQEQGNISDLIRINECNQELWGFQRLDEDKKYDWVIEDIFIQNTWSANMGSGKSQMLGKGAFGNVIKVKDNNTQIQYALKFIKKSFFTKAITETEIMKKFNDDKYIIQYHDIYLYDQQMERNQVIEIQQYLVIVMELAQASLEDILKQRITCQAHWTTTELLTIMKHISMALKSLAQKNIAHRDLKPSNILYCLKTQQYKLADFGEAKVVLNIDFDEPHTPRGTKRYMSPELLNGLNNSKLSSSRAIKQYSEHSPEQKQKNMDVEIQPVNQASSHQSLPEFMALQPSNEHLELDLTNKQKSMKKASNNSMEKHQDEVMIEEQKIRDVKIDSKAQSIPKQNHEINLSKEKIPPKKKGSESKDVYYEPYSNDIYSLGLCFFQMKYLDDLSKYNGHDGKALASEQYFYEILQEDDAVDQLISSMINLDPKKRPQISQVIEFIEEELLRVSKDQEGITFNYEPSSSNTIDQHKVLKSINETQILNGFGKEECIMPDNSKDGISENDNHSQNKKDNKKLMPKQQQMSSFTNEDGVIKCSFNNKKHNSQNQNDSSNTSSNSLLNNQISKNSSHSQKIHQKNTNSPKISKKFSENTNENKMISKLDKENDRAILLEEDEACQKQSESKNLSSNQNKKSLVSIEQLESKQNNNSSSQAHQKKSIIVGDIISQPKINKQEFKIQSSQFIYHFNNTYDNLINDKIVVGSSKCNNNINQNNIHSSSSEESEEDDSNYDYEDEDDVSQEEEEEDSQAIENEKQSQNKQEDNKNNSDHQEYSFRQAKNGTEKRRPKINLPLNLFEEHKEYESTLTHDVECKVNKVNELQFLKLMETKKQSNLSITQKIQYIIARAQAYESLLKFQKARDTFQELYEKHFQCLSPLDQINLLKNLGRLDHKMSKFDSSIKFYQQLLELLKQSKELNDLQVSEVYQMLGSAHCFQGDYQAALKYYAESLSKKEMLKDSIEQEEIADLLVYIGLVKKHLGQYQSSLENYEKALQIVNLNPEKNLKRISCIKKNIGSVYDHMQNNTQSVQFLESALQDMIQAYGTENERVVNCLNKLGIVLVHSGMHNHEQAIKHFERAMKIMKKLYKMDTINETHRKQFKFKDTPLNEAIHPLYTRALDVNEEAYILYRQVYDYYHVGVGIILEIRGMIYHFLNDFQYALKYYNEALNIYTIILKSEHEFVKRSIAYVNIAKAGKKFQNFPKLR